MVEHYFNVGLVIGRFQPLHKGHERMIETALGYCNKVVVVIGSAQASGTKENPLTWADRYTIILHRFSRDCNDQRLFIVPVNDREVYSDDSSFGEYIYKQITDALGEEFTPDCIIEGKEGKHDNWWKSVSLNGHIEVDRNGLSVSGTELRNAIGNSVKDYIDRYQSTESQEYNFKIWEIMNR